MGIDEKYKPIIEKHIKFFAARSGRSGSISEIENFNEENIITRLCRHLPHPDLLFRGSYPVMLTDSTLEDNKFLMETENTDFWGLLEASEQHFGYADVKPTLEKLVVTMFVTYTASMSLPSCPSRGRRFPPTRRATSSPSWTT